MRCSFTVLWAPVVIATAVGSCDAPNGDAGSPFTVRDSAEVEVTTYHSLDQWQAPVELVELVRVGSAEGARDLLFSNIAGGMIRDDGSIVLADGQSREVRFFDPEGRPVRTHGREGEGPGEYRFIIGMGKCRPDGFTVFDIGWPMSFYDENGDFVEEDNFRLEDSSTPYHLACHPDGRRAAINWDLDTGRQRGFVTASANLRIFNEAGEEILSLGERIGSERWSTPTGSAPHPAGRSTRFGFQGSDLVVSDGEFFGYERWDESGSLTEIVRLEVAPPDVDSLSEAYMEATLARTDDEATRARWRTSVDAMEWPERSTYFSDMMVRSEGVLLQEVSFGGMGRWFLFSPEGEPVGYLPLPSGARLLDMQDSQLLVEVRSDLDVPQAVLYSIQSQER